jgi:hypothetical protein
MLMIAQIITDGTNQPHGMINLTRALKINKNNSTKTLKLVLST